MAVPIRRAIMRYEFVTRLFNAKFILNKITGDRIAHGLRKIVMNSRMALKKFTSAPGHPEPGWPTIQSISQEVPGIFLFQCFRRTAKYFAASSDHLLPDFVVVDFIDSKF
jgi:hypothetical protein